MILSSKQWEILNEENKRLDLNTNLQVYPLKLEMFEVSPKRLLASALEFLNINN